MKYAIVSPCFHCSSVVPLRSQAAGAPLATANARARIATANARARITETIAAPNRTAMATGPASQRMITCGTAVVCRRWRTTAPRTRTATNPQAAASVSWSRPTRARNILRAPSAATTSPGKYAPTERSARRMAAASPSRLPLAARASCARAGDRAAHQRAVTSSIGMGATRLRAASTTNAAAPGRRA